MFVVDSPVEAGRTVGYAVVAADPGGTWSRAVDAVITVFPPVHRPTLAVRDGALTGTWRTHPDMIGVRVQRRADGDSGVVEVPTTGTTAFRDSEADPESDWTFLLTARYRCIDGREADSETIALRHTARPAPTLPPITALDHRVFGAEVVLSWVWPDGVRVAEVTWTNPEHDSATRMLTRQQYQAEGGCRIKTGPGTIEVQVCSTTSDGAARSEPCALPVRLSPSRVEYRVQRRSRLFQPGTACIVLTSEHPVRDCEVLIVIAPGRVMPLKPEAGEVVHRGVHQIDEPVELTIALPSRKPYWLRCFVTTPGIDLIDPPISQLKVT